MTGGHPLHLKLFNVSKGVLKLFGLGGRQFNLQGVRLLLDPHIAHLKTMEDYTATISVFEYTNTTYDEETDQMHVHGVPVGDHVLTLVSPIDTSLSEAAALTHLVIF